MTPHRLTGPDLPSYGAQHLDPPFHAAMARLSSSNSSASAALAFTDWFIHLAHSPGRRMDLAHLAFDQARRFGDYALSCARGGAADAPACVEPKPGDRRFAEPQWQTIPFNLIHQSFLLTEQWWMAATRGVWAVEPHHENKISFLARQWLDLISPGNYIATNPVVLEQTASENGANLMRGLQHWLEDAQRQLAGAPPVGAEGYEVGRNLATTPGRVVLRNDLMELIQYEPRTGKVHPEPVLIVPAWIMKYYILDLAPGSSLVAYLLEQGHTVYCISWKNPKAEDRNIGFDDYRRLGLMAALDSVGTLQPGRKVHAVGYCIGGTLLAIGAAAMARDGDARLASLTLFAAQTDFTEPGELALFIDESQVGLLEAQMAETGYLTAQQMAGAFQMLRSYDLLWSRVVHDYLLGRRAPMNELMAWNTDATRMPARMHSEYLRGMFLRNDLAEGRHRVGGKRVALGDLRLPIYMVGTVTDHVAPWRSVYKLHQLSPAEITFVLTTGGHNAGIVSPVGQPRRSYRALTRPAAGSTLPPEDWEDAAPQTQGSWWPHWQAWLADHSGKPTQPPRGGRSLGAAPGRYVMEK